MAAPICHITPPTSPAAPTSKPFPSIPLASPNLVSLTTSVNAIKIALELLAGQAPSSSTVFTPIDTGGLGGSLVGVGGAAGQPGTPGKKGQQGTPGKPGKDAKQPKVGRWQEYDRQTAMIRVTNPNDDSQYVDVEIITQLIMKDSVTGELWTWVRGDNTGG